MKTLKQICLILLFGSAFFLFSQKAIAQEKEKISKHPEVQSLIALGNTIQSGEVHLIANEQIKGSPSISTKNYQVLFYRTGEIINIWKSEEKSQEHKNFILEMDSNLNSLANSHYNILNLTDSMQYVYNGKIWWIIDHKNKTCQVDTSWCKVACSFPFLYPQFLAFSEMFPFYIQGWLKLSFEEARIENIEKKGDTTILKIVREGVSPKGVKSKSVLYAEQYVWDKEKSVLLHHIKVLKDEKGIAKNTLIVEEMKLLDANLNDEKYANPELYNGLNYAKSYKTTYTKYPKRK